MRPPRRGPLLFTLVLAVALPAAGAADPIAYGSRHGVNGPFSELWIWDLATGDATPVGVFGSGGFLVQHLALDLEGRLYGIDQDLRLVEVDPLTAGVTVIGPLDEPGPIFFRGLAFDACGRLWATGYTFQGEPGSSEVERWLFEIDPETGHLERLATGDDYEIFSLVGRGTRLWGQGVDGLVVVELEGLSVRTIGGGAAPGGVPLGLGFAADGVLWGTSAIPPPPITVPPGFGQYAFTLDRATGEPTLVTEQIPVPTGDFAILPPAGFCGGPSALPIPALGRSGAMALALLLAAAGMLWIARPWHRDCSLWRR